jgi:hypothetical protein
MDRAPLYESEGCGFESRWARLIYSTQYKLSSCHNWIAPGNKVAPIHRMRSAFVLRWCVVETEACRTEPSFFHSIHYAYLMTESW